MDKNVGFLELLPPESLKLTLHLQTLFQRQHADYWSIENVVYADYDLFICTGGKAEFSQGKVSSLLTEGEAFLALPGIPLQAKHIGEDYFRAAAQHFSLKVFGEIDFFSLINYRRVLRFSNWEYIDTLLGRYKELAASGRKRLEQYSIFHTILFEFIYDAFQSENSEHKSSYNFIFQMLAYIQEHLTEKDVLEKTLLLSAYTHDYTSRVFKKRLGMPPKQYILKSRLDLSQNLLLRKEFSIKEIAYRCGFSDEYYFSRLFRKYLNLSPRAFRKQHISFND